MPKQTHTHTQLFLVKIFVNEIFFMGHRLLPKVRSKYIYLCRLCGYHNEWLWSLDTYFTVVINVITTGGKKPAHTARV